MGKYTDLVEKTLNEATEISVEEFYFLAGMRALKSAYRTEMPEAVKTALQNAGYIKVNKAGIAQITPAGKKALNTEGQKWIDDGNFTPEAEKQLTDLRKKYDYDVPNIWHIMAGR